MTAALELDELEIRYGAVAAVRRLSLEVDHGEIVGLIGPNGAGKSTTLNAIMGLVPVHGGEIRLAGSSIRGRRTEALVRSGIALVPEGRRIYANLTVAENLRLGLTGRRLKGSAAREDDIEWVHDLFPAVAQFADRPAGTLSGGQQQQLAIARALVARPDVLLLDEPLLGLAPQLVSVVFDVLAQIRAWRHDPARRAAGAKDGRLADRTYVPGTASFPSRCSRRATRTTPNAQVAAYFGS
jgi:branched-chain amino acid transport system ATP-binding protein